MEKIEKYYVARYIEETSRRIPVTRDYNPILEHKKYLVESRVEDIRQVLYVIHKYKDLIQNDTFCLY